MKFSSAIFAAGLPVLLCTQASAQPMQQQQQAPGDMQVEQQACQDDVYALCGQAIPDQNRIASCLRQNWSKVSPRCRSVMASYGKRHNGNTGHNGSSTERD